MTSEEIRDPHIQGHPSIRRLPDRLLRPIELGRLVSSVGADAHLWRRHVRHDPGERWHARLHWSPTVEVYLLGWEIGQDTRLHDHGGSRGAFFVADGELSEQYARVGSGTLHERRHPVQTVTPFSADYLHNLGNAGPRLATSVHAYSPPLSVMRFYERSRRSGSFIPAYQLPVDGPEPDPSAAPVPVGSAAEATT